MIISSREKTAQQAVQEHKELLGTPRVSIEPYSSMVDKAVGIVNSRNPELLRNVSDVRINLSKGVIGEYQSGSPSTIWINIGKLESDVRSKMSGQSQELIDNEMVNQISQTLIHEATHQREYSETGSTSEAGPERAEEQFRQQTI
jgi:hypothetical protein